MNKKIIINRPLEISIVHGCNLSCKGCSHFSDYAHTRKLTLDEIYSWIKPWSELVQPKPKDYISHFGILGGEPLLHENICEILTFSRKCFPNCQIRLTTNGFLAKRHPNLPKILHDNNILLKVSIHSEHPYYLEKCSESINLIKKWEKKGVKVAWADLRSNYWELPYVREKDLNSPYDDKNPRESWKNCLCKCYQIFNYKIWKCPKITYLKIQKNKFPNTVSEKFDKYLDYEGLSLNSSFSEKIKFFNKKEEFICGMCPKKIKFTPRKNLPLPLPLPLNKTMKNKENNKENNIEIEKILESTPKEKNVIDSLFKKNTKLL